MMKYIIICALLFCFIEQACKNEDSIIVKKWINQEIIFPDSLKKNLNIAWDNQYKILNYIGPEGCITCKLNFPDWKKIIKETEINGYAISFIFDIYTNDYVNLGYEININDFRHPIIFDKHDELNKINKFPHNHKYTTFLLDANNKVLSVGNPAANPQIWKLYKKIITSK